MHENSTGSMKYFLGAMVWVWVMQWALVKDVFIFEGKRCVHALPSVADRHRRLALAKKESECCLGVSKAGFLLIPFWGFEYALDSVCAAQCWLGVKHLAGEARSA